MKNLLAEKWQEYAVATLPYDCPDIRRERAQAAFYAGAASVIELQKEFGYLTDQEANDRMDSIIGELKLFEVRHA